MASVLVLAAVALIIPTVFHFSAADKWSKGMEVKLSLFIAVILIVSYATLLLFSLKTHKSLFSDNESVDEVLDNDDTEHGHTPWSTKKSIWVLVGATTMVAILSEYLVSSVEFAGHALGLTPVFVGVIVVAIIGNAAEHSTAIFMARKNKMNLAFNIAVGSSIQIALFVAPVLVFISHLLGAPIDLEFSLAEVVSVGAAVYLTSQVCNDGECNWFEGFQLLAVYAIIAVLFYYLPVS